MVAPTLTPLTTTKPEKGQPKAEFDIKFQAFIDWLFNHWHGDATAMINYLNGQAQDVADAIVNNPVSQQAYADYLAAFDGQLSRPENLIPDHGKLSEAASSPWHGNDVIGDSSDYFSTYNGSSIAITTDKFIHNNSTHGGSGDSISSVITELLTTMDRINKVNGSSFSVVRISAGAGTLTPKIMNGVTKYYANNVDHRHGKTALTAAYWIKGDCFVYGKINGSNTENWHHLSHGLGWNHVLNVTNESEVGYQFSPFNNLYLGLGDNVLLAVPYLASGKVNLLPTDHTSIIN